MYNTDKKIKKVFKLFQGIRSEEEDRKIYEKVQNHVFLEIIAFFEDNLPEKRKEKLIEEISNLSDNEASQALFVFAKYAKEIEDARYRLEKRINAYINNLFAQSMGNLEDSKTRENTAPETN